MRLQHRREYRLVYEHGLRVPGDRLVLFVRPNELGVPRFGATATRKVGNAVQRNRARRQLREIFRHHRSAFGSWDFVINVRASAIGAPSVRLEEELLRLARRARRMLEARGATGT